MSKIIHVSEAKPLGGRRLFLRFEDGAEGELDFSTDSWRGIFAPLEDPDFFARVEVDHELGTVVWPNGADVAPETLHAWVKDRVGTVPA